ncbi:MAG: tetratricopeptide repeat protein, partial [Phycisphaerales bacterium]|nr:tetratricopeptide repeat protein [Phycisphaerales bacterium]
LIGTLQYMSPEQVELDPGELDTRSDVYALGVMLYELLVDRMPYDLTGTSLTQAASRIREIQPKRLGEINANLKGDLETICLKALEKDREQRYQTVNDLAEDVRRYLADEPIMARPPTRAEQIRRFVRKNKAASVATCVVAAALVAATAISIVFAVESGRQRDAAEHARQDADTQRTLAEAKTTEVQKQAEEMQTMVDFQAQQLSEIDVPAMGTSLKNRMLEQFEENAEDPAAIDFTGSSLQLLNEHIFSPTLASIEAQFADQPLVQGRLLQTIAETLTKLGLHFEAEAPQQSAVALHTALLGSEHPVTLESEYHMSVMLSAQGNYAEALAKQKKILEIQRRVLGVENDATIDTINAIGSNLITLVRLDEASAYCEEEFTLCQAIYDPEHPSYLRAARSQIALRVASMDHDESTVLLAQQTLDATRRSMDSGSRDVYIAMSYVGQLKLLENDVDAEAVLIESLSGLRRTLGNKHPMTVRAMIWLIFMQMQLDGTDVTRTKPLILEATEASQGVFGELDVHRLLLDFATGLMYFVQFSAAGDPDGLTEHAIPILQSTLNRAKQMESESGSTMLSSALEPLLLQGYWLDKILRGDFEGAIQPAIELEVAGRSFSQNTQLSGYAKERAEEAYIQGGVSAVAFTYMGLEQYDQAIPYLHKLLGFNAEKGDGRMVQAVAQRLATASKAQFELHVGSGNHEEALDILITAHSHICEAMGVDDNKWAVDFRSAVFLHCNELTRLGKAGERIDFITLACEIQDRILGEEHPQPMLDRENYCGVFSRSSSSVPVDPMQRLEDSLQKLSTTRTDLGESHPRTTDLLVVILTLYKDLHQADPDAGHDVTISDFESQLDETIVFDPITLSPDTIQYAKTSLDARRRVLGNDHLHTLTCMRSMARWFHDRDRYVDASPYYLEMIDGYQRTMGERHPNTINTLGAIIDLHRDWHEAEPDAGHDGTAAKYQTQLDAIMSGMEEPATP